MTDGNEKKIVVDTPSEEENRLLNMTAEEYHQYIREHPEEARREVAKYMARFDFSEAYNRILESFKSLGDGLQAAAGSYTAETIGKYIAESLQNLGRADALLNAPEWLDAEALEKFYREFDALEEYITAELARDPEGPHRTAAELLDAVDLESIYVAAEIDAHGEPQEEPEEPIKEEARRLLGLIRKARAAKLAADQEAKRDKFIDPVGFKTADYKPVYNGNLTNGLMRLTTRDFVPDRRGINAYYEAPNGQKYEINDFDKFTGSLGVSCKKLLDAAAMSLTSQNYYKTKNINPTVHIPLIDYGERNGYKLTPEAKDTPEEQEKENKRVRQRIKEFRLKCKSDLLDLEKIAYTAEETTGRNAGEYQRLGIITKSHSVRGGVITVPFDPMAAKYLINGGPMWYPLELFSIDNRKNNTYCIGRKIVAHNSNDNNFFSGTDCTLSVKSLLNAAPEIPTKQEIEESGNRNWKVKIKGLLEKSLNELVDPYPIITKWEYRHPKTGETYTAEQAQGLPWETYSVLMVDWVMKKTPKEQEARRAKLLEEKKKAAETAPVKPKKKRGRPPKKAPKK